MAAIEGAITLSLKKDDIFMSALPFKLLFGIIDFSQKQYKAKQYFEIPIFQIHQWYLAFVKIIEAFTNTSKTTEGPITILNDSVTYYWKLLNKNIIFGIETNLNVSFEVLLTDLEFNNFVLVLKQLIIPTLCFKPCHTLVFKTALLCELNDILKLKTDQNAEAFVNKTLSSSKNLSYDDYYSSQIFLTYYLEIIIVNNLLNTMYNPAENLTSKIIATIT